MITLEQIIELDDEVETLHNKYYTEIWETKFAQLYPHTLGLSYSFTKSTYLIKNAIFDCSESDNVYSAQVLYRCLIEHYLRFHYISLSFGQSPSDSTSEKYINICNDKEKSDMIKSIKNSQKLYEGENQPPFWQEILDAISNPAENPDCEAAYDSSKLSHKDIITGIKQFSGPNRKPFFVLGDLVQTYSRLSSYVHGGTRAHHELESFQDKQIRDKEYIQICGMSFLMTLTVKDLVLLLMFLTDKKEFDNYHIQYTQIFKKYIALDSIQ